MRQARGIAVACALGIAGGCSETAGRAVVVSAAPSQLAVAPAPAASQISDRFSSDDDLIGVWGAEWGLGATSTGRVELAQRDGAWTMSAMGATVPCTQVVSSAPASPKGAPKIASVGPELICRLGQGGHALRLQRGLAGPSAGSGVGAVAAPAGEVIEGYWLQPEVQFVARGGYATPLGLRRQADGHFIGEAPLMSTRLAAVLAIGRRPSGALFGFVREREQNLGRLIGRLEVHRDGAALRLVGSDATLPATLVHGAPGAGDDVIELPLPDTQVVLQLRRLAPELVGGPASAAELFPRPPPASYVPPAASDDGWPVAAAADVGMSPAPLDAMAAELGTAMPSNWNDLAVHSVVIAKRGRLVFERYFAGYGPEDPHDVRSAGKSFATTLTGIAVDRGELRADQAVGEILGMTFQDARWRALRVKHLLSMSSGLACDDEQFESPGNEDRMQQGAEPDWYRYTLALPMARDPGAMGVYCTAGINLLGALLEKRSGAWIPQLLVERLLAPLQMRNYHVNMIPTGQGYLGGGLRLRPRDMAKLGQVFIGEGRWNGKRIVSPAWIAAATAPHASLDRFEDYGYGWWRTTFSVERAAFPAFYASGNGGQLIIGIPALEAVVVFTAGNYGNRRAWQRILDDLMPRYVIPALLGR